MGWTPISGQRIDQTGLVQKIVIELTAARQIEVTDHCHQGIGRLRRDCIRQLTELLLLHASENPMALPVTAVIGKDVGVDHHHGHISPMQRAYEHPFAKESIHCRRKIPAPLFSERFEMPGCQRRPGHSDQPAFGAMQMGLVGLERIARTRLKQQVLICNELNLLQANDLQAALLQVMGQGL